jgi:hypothetical protein
MQVFNVQKRARDIYYPFEWQYAWCNVYYADTSGPAESITVALALAAAEKPLYCYNVLLDRVAWYPLGSPWTTHSQSVISETGSRPDTGEDFLPWQWAALLNFDQGVKRPVAKFLRLVPQPGNLSGALWGPDINAALATYAEAVRAITPLVRSRLGDALGPASWASSPWLRVPRHGTKRAQRVSF